VRGAVNHSEDVFSVLKDCEGFFHNPISKTEESDREDRYTKAQKRWQFSRKVSIIRTLCKTNVLKMIQKKSKKIIPRES